MTDWRPVLGVPHLLLYGSGDVLQLNCDPELDKQKKLDGWVLSVLLNFRVTCLCWLDKSSSVTLDSMKYCILNCIFFL